MRYRIDFARKGNGNGNAMGWLLLPVLFSCTQLGASAAAVVSRDAAMTLRSTHNATTEAETMQQRIMRITEDVGALGEFYNIDISPQRVERLEEYYNEQLTQLKDQPFDSLDQQDKVDYLLIQNYMRRQLRQLELDAERDAKMKPLLPFAPIIIRLSEDRQKMKPIDPKKAAADLYEAEKMRLDIMANIESGDVEVDKTSAFRAVNAIDDLAALLEEWFGFFNGYDPMFTWWATEPYNAMSEGLKALSPLILQKLVGVSPEEKDDAIVGDPIGADGLAADLEAEMIPYSTEELVEIGEKEYEWCEAEMIKASKDLGYGKDWRKALEHVKNLYVEPGNQTQLVHELAIEAIDYMKEHDLITVPPLAEEVWRMVMLSPEQQRVSPFFLGGKYIQVAYPTNTMTHEEKLMSLRGNNVHFSRSVVHHELIPGHNLQFFMNSRNRPYRGLFGTPFWVEGWSLYWEMVLWDMKFPATPENRIGMLWWRMHRCARIIFSLKFHLGEMQPQEAIDFLVEKVGHERSTAEGEVRRSFAGNYSPLYQAGYMLGALQIYAMRKELEEAGGFVEKEFHDRILRENEMPIEMLRALITEQDLSPDFEASWRFYDSRD